MRTGDIVMATNDHSLKFFPTLMTTVFVYGHETLLSRSRTVSSPGPVLQALGQPAGAGCGGLFLLGETVRGNVATGGHDLVKIVPFSPEFLIEIKEIAEETEGFLIVVGVIGIEPLRIPIEKPELSVPGV